MSKVLAILSQSPDVMAGCRELEELTNRAKGRVDFLRRQVEAIAKARDEDAKSIWARIEKALGDKLPADYGDGSKYNLHFDFEEDSMVIFTRSETSAEPDIGIIVQMLAKGLHGGLPVQFVGSKRPGLLEKLGAWWRK